VAFSDPTCFSRSWFAVPLLLIISRSFFINTSFTGIFVDHLEVHFGLKSTPLFLCRVYPFLAKNLPFVSRIIHDAEAHSFRDTLWGDPETVFSPVVLFALSIIPVKSL